MKTREQQISQVTWIGMVINAVLTLFKLIAGVVGKSSAMIADGVHSLSDFISDIVILVFLKISTKGRDKDHDFGHGKFETMATFILSIILILVAAEILMSGVKKIHGVLNGEDIPTPSLLALIAAAVSIVGKEFCFQITKHVGKRVNSPALMANAWHHRSDALSSIGSLIGIGGAIWIGHKWVVLDPVMGCIIALVIFVLAIKMAVPAMKELMDIALPEETENEIMTIASGVDGVTNVHNLKTRRNGPSTIIDAHIMVDHTLGIVEAHDIATHVEAVLKERYGQDAQISLHTEPDNITHALYE